MSRILFAAKRDLDGITHEQTFICRQLFADHVVGSQPLKMQEKIDRMITNFYGVDINIMEVYHVEYHELA